MHVSQSIIIYLPDEGGVGAVRPIKINEIIKIRVHTQINVTHLKTHDMS